MASSKRRTLTFLGLAAALGVAATIGVQLYEKYSVIRYVKNLTIAESAREESLWDLVATRRGTLIRAKHGAFRGWYLGVDETALASERPAIVQMPFRGGPKRYGRYVVLADRITDTCYWKFDDTPKPTPTGGARPNALLPPGTVPVPNETTYSIRSAARAFEGWSLDFRSTYLETTGNIHTGWNALLAPPGTSDPTRWRKESEKGGTRLYISDSSFRNWRLDYHEDAEILERNPWGTPPPEESQVQVSN